MGGDSSDLGYVGLVGCGWVASCTVQARGIECRADDVDLGADVDSGVARTVVP